MHASTGCGDDDDVGPPALPDAGPMQTPHDAGPGPVAGRGEPVAGHGEMDSGVLMPAPKPDATVPDASDVEAGEVESNCPGDVIEPEPLGDTPQALRSDVTVQARLSIPGDTTRLARDPSSNAIYLLRQSGDVHRVDFAGDRTVPAWSASDMQIPAGYEALGMAFGPDGSLYVVTHRTAETAPADLSQATIVRGTPGSGGELDFAVFASSDDYPRSNTFFDHEWSGVVVSPDGAHVYVNCGSRTDHGEVQDTGGLHPDTRELALSARVLRLPTDGATPLVIPNDEAQLQAQGWVFARGTRNSFDLEFAPNGDLLAPDNGPDGDYHEELNWLRQGHHYGFPWRMGNEDNAMASSPYDPMTDRRLQEGYSATRAEYWHDDPDFPAATGLTFTDPIVNNGPDADQYRNTQTGAVAKASDSGTAFATFSDHGSPLGLTFDSDAGDLCEEFSGNAFVLRFGVGADPNDFEVGRDLLALDLRKRSGIYSLSARQLVRGFNAPIDALLDGGTMYVADRTADGSASGTLYIVTLPAPP
jgi:hypothetical protein